MEESQSSKKPPQILDSLHLYHTSLASLSIPIPHDHHHHHHLSSFPLPSSLPPSKLIPKTRFLVDAFRFATSSSVTYFLSHFHSDHYTGLSRNWCQGLIFCSLTTANLLTQVLKIPKEFVFPLPLRDPVIIDGIEVTLIDANHCPGAIQFLFKVPGKNQTSTEMYIHTGDFRFCGSMKEDCLLSQFVGCNTVFLDATYCNPKFVFPSQEESIDYIASVVERIGGEFVGQERSVLFLVATYVVGKEKILLEIAGRCKRKMHVDGRKMEVLRVLGYGESGVFTEDESESDVHVVGWNVLGETWPYFRPNFVKMKEIMVERGYSKVVGFVPTGWTYEVKRNKFSVKSKDSFEIHLVPYSEHSNYDELREFVKFLKPKHVIPVGVNIEKLDSKEAIKMQKHFAGLLDEMANKKEFLMGFHRGSLESDEKVGMEDVSGLNEGLGHKKEVRSSVVNAPEDKEPGIILNSSSTLQEPGSQNLTILHDNETEKIIQELGDCLPEWVTRDQMLHLINSSARNLVDAVSNFYEHETEFHQQVFAQTTSIFSSQTGALNEPETLSKPVSIKSSQESLGSPLSQNYKSSNTKPSIKSGITHGKRKNVDSKRRKKVKTNSKLEPGGPKQSTITRFFNKLVPEVSQGSVVRIIPKQCPVDENSLLNDDAKSYKEKIDQFIQIIDGNESSRSYAATILERTKGNLTKALDMHYGNPEGSFGKIVGGLVASGDSVQPQCHSNECSSAQDRTVSEEKEHIDLSLKRSLTENVAPALVALPLEKYSPIQHACWKAGEPAPYIHIARTFDLVEAEKGKIKATKMLCNMFRSLLALSPEDVLPAVYLCTNKIAADHENIELNIGGSLVTSAIKEACGTNRSKIRDMYNSLGDLGDVAQACRQTQTLLAPPPHLLIKDVFSVLRKISVQRGTGSTVQKKNLIVYLMRCCREKEMKFIVRTLVKNLRIGAMLKTVLPALAQAVALNSLVNVSDEQKAENVKEKLQYLSTAVVEAYNILPNVDLIVHSLMSRGIEFSSSDLSMVPGVPIKPMLAKITNGVSQALELFQDKAFTCECKYDGQRAQIHKLSNGTVRVFSRNGEETTSRFPDLVNIIEESCKPAAVTFILDAEVVAVDRKNGCKLMSFQELSSRERGSKNSLITVNNIKVEICVFVFDIMFANGEQLLELPLRQRRKYLKDLFCDERMGYFEYAKEMTVEACDACLTNEATTTKIKSFLKDALDSSCEGIMVKSLDAHAEYSPSKRTYTWLKVKRDYVDGLNDSLDLVPIGAWHGNGRKAGWYSPFLMACYNPDAEEFQCICRVMSGFSDAFYIEMKEFFSGDRVLLKKPPYYLTREEPDLWFPPELVWQIRGADLTLSPVHQAAVGLVHPSRGISMRFPRYIRSVSDRNAEDCSTAADIAEMYDSQPRKVEVKDAN